MALFLRGGVLALLTERWGWAPQVAIIPAVALGWAVMLPGYTYALSATRDRAGTRAFAFGVIAYLAMLRLIYAGSVELLPEEAYYWDYSRHLDFGYLDHPPMVAWLIRLGTSLFGQTEFGVRAGALCCGALTSLFVYKLARNLFDEGVALAALVLAQALPFFFLSGMLMTPDAPLTAAWAGTLYFLERALIGGQSSAWLRAGICLGVGLISKYSIALLIPTLAVFMIWDPKSRRWWGRYEPYLAGLVALAIFSPVIVWNAEHDWASFAFQTSRRLAEAPHFALPRLLASILILITPTGVLAIIAALAREKARPRFMVLAIFLPLSVFGAFSLRHEVKLDWTGALWSAALPAMGFTMIATGRMRAAWAPTVVAMLLIYAAGLHYLVLGLPGLGYGKHIELVPVGWRELNQHIIDTAEIYRKQNDADVLIVGMDRYAIASELAFYGEKNLHSPVETMNSHLFGGMSLMYGRWTPPESQKRRDLLLVAFDEKELTDLAVEAHVERLGPIEDDVLVRDGSVIRHYYHRFAYNYRGFE
jgi:dolichol-phosphate mannosyltransferase